MASFCAVLCAVHIHVLYNIYAIQVVDNVCNAFKQYKEVVRFIVWSHVMSHVGHAQETQICRCLANDAYKRITNTYSRSPPGLIEFVNKLRSPSAICYEKKHCCRESIYYVLSYASICFCILLRRVVPLLIQKVITSLSPFKIPIPKIFSPL